MVFLTRRAKVKTGMVVYIEKGGASWNIVVANDSL